MNEAMMKETIVSREKIYEGKIIDVEKWVAGLPNGKTALREIVLHKGASAIVPVDSEGNVYLVRQFRMPFQKISLEIPAGKLDYAGEDRFECAKRELKEETGFTAAEWKHLTDLETTPGFCTEVISVYLAQGLSKGDTDFDDDEFIDLVKMPVREAADMVMRGEIADAKTISGILMADKYLSSEE
ncbi:MAG: NUDIX hydrolase [Clostridia bacterium]|nr:NUDIX hydrolase [Clostridia bacterium]